MGYSKTNLLESFDLNMSHLENSFLSKEFEHISIKFEIDSVYKWSKEESHDTPKFGRNNHSGKDVFNRSLSVRRDSINRCSGFAKTQEMKNHWNKENENAVNINMNRRLRTKDYSMYRKMGVNNFVERSWSGRDFSKQKLVLAMQR